MPRVTKKCVVCDVVFEVYPYRSLTAKVCSYKCSSELLRKKGSKERKCENCGNIFHTHNSQFKYYSGAGRYCSRGCHYKHKVKVNRDKPVKDKYGRSKRTDDKNWQKSVREKDNFTCQRCGIYDPYIHTHHVILRSRSLAFKHQVSNGICLCNSCHSWVHNNPKKATELGFIKRAPIL